jgi:hypothetical protein
VIATPTEIGLPFTQNECEAAYAEWRCNCGPAALAAVLGLPLHRVRPAVEAAGFGRSRPYLSPTMMAAALRNLGARWADRRPGAFDVGGLAFPRRGLARIQWEGPWTADGANPRWAYRHTHWVASWKPKCADALTAMFRELAPVLFDVNGGLMELDRWEDEIVPLITRSIPRADGDWHVTHSWEIESCTTT